MTSAAQDRGADDPAAVPAGTAPTAVPRVRAPAGPGAARLGPAGHAPAGPSVRPHVDAARRPVVPGSGPAALPRPAPGTAVRRPAVPGTAPVPRPAALPGAAAVRRARVPAAVRVRLPVVASPLLAAIPLWIVALVQIRRTGEDGKGLAIAALVISGLQVIFGGLILLAIIAAGGDDEPDASAPQTGYSQPATSAPTGPTDPAEIPVSIGALGVGKCFDDTAKHDGEVLTRTCGVPHDAEVIGREDLPKRPYPGERAVSDSAQQACDAVFTSYIGISPYKSRFITSFSYPGKDSWDSGDREVICVVYDSGGAPFTGSVTATTRRRCALIRSRLFFPSV